MKIFSLKMNMRFFYRKYLDNFYPEIGYENIYTRKKYVSDPQVNWLKNELYEWTLDRISSKFLKKSNLYNQDKLIEYFENLKLTEILKILTFSGKQYVWKNFQETLIEKNFLRQAKFLTS